MSVADPFGLVGQVLDGQFRVDKLVGEGGFSAVYRGHHQGLNEPIAIKSLKLPSSLGTSLADTFVSRFRDESRILYRLSQGNLHIVRSIAAGTTQAPLTGALVPYMVLEWLEGRSVQNDFTVRRTLGQTGRSLDVVLKLFESAADGLGYAHAQGVAHRDLNPGNLFLAQTQHGLKMKVLDFGVAKLMHDGALNMGPRAHTVGHIKIFAPAYGAPEQFDDRIGTAGAFSDVYAFALILIEALRDKSVNEGTHLGEFARSACDPDKRPTPRAFGIDVPDEVEAAFARATTLDPKERWQSVGDFWQSLSIASKVATERRYESAARETPPLAMGGTPPPSPVTPGPAAAPRDAAVVKNLARTIPLGSATLPRPGLAGAAPGTPGAPRPRTPTTIGIPAPAGARAPAAAASGTGTTPGPGPGKPGTGTAPTAAPLAAPPPAALGRTMAMPMTPGTAIGAPRAAVRAPSSARHPAPPHAPAASDRPPGASTTEPAPPLAPPRLGSNPALGAFARTDAKPPSSRRAGSSIPTSAGVAPARESNEVVDIPSMNPLPDDDEEDEDEATKVHAPAPEMLRTLAFHEAANARAQAEAMIARERASRAAATQAAAKPPYIDPNEDIPEPPPSGGTLMMAPVARQQMMDAAAPPPPQWQNQSLNSTLAMASPLQPTGPNDWGAPTQAMAAVPMPPVQAAPGMHGIPGAHGTPPQGVPAVSLPGNLPAPLPYGQGSAVIPQQQQQQQQHSPSAVPLSRQPGEHAFPPPSFAQAPAPPKAPLPILPIAIVLGVLALGGIVMGAFALRARHAVPTDGDAAAASSGPMVSASLTPVPVALPDDPAPAVATAIPVPVAVAEEDAAVDASVVAEVDAAPAVPAVVATATAPTSAPVPTTAPPNPFGQPTAIATPPPPKPTADPNAFSESGARAKLAQANGVLAFCHKEGGVTGNGSASVTFGPDGNVVGVAIDPPFGGTKEGDCVASQFRRVKVNAFTGSPQTVRTQFEVPK